MVIIKFKMILMDVYGNLYIKFNNIQKLSTLIKLIKDNPSGNFLKIYYKSLYYMLKIEDISNIFLIIVFSSQIISTSFDIYIKPFIAHIISILASKIILIFTIYLIHKNYKGMSLITPNLYIYAIMSFLITILNIVSIIKDKRGLEKKLNEKNNKKDTNKKDTSKKDTDKKDTSKKDTDKKDTDKKDTDKKDTTNKG